MGATVQNSYFCKEVCSTAILFHEQLQAFEPYDTEYTAVQSDLLDKCSEEFLGKAVQDYFTFFSYTAL